jgi:hypothetical protein
MSAYIVSRKHIEYLVMAAMSQRITRGHLLWWFNNDQHNELRSGDYDKAVKVGQMLWDENIKSVLCRYPEDTKETAPGPCGENYVFALSDNAPWLEFDPVQVLKACDCYEYQSCEHDEWKSSEAFDFINRLRQHAWSSIKGYEDAAWGPPKTRREIEEEYKQKHGKVSIYFGGLARCER